MSHDALLETAISRLLTDKKELELYRSDPKTWLVTMGFDEKLSHEFIKSDFIGIEMAATSLSYKVKKKKKTQNRKSTLVLALLKFARNFCSKYSRSNSN